MPIEDYVEKGIVGSRFLLAVLLIVGALAQGAEITAEMVLMVLAFYFMSRGVEKAGGVGKVVVPPLSPENGGGPGKGS